MATRTGWTIADYMALDEPDGPHFELSDGELIVTPSTTLNHNAIRDRLNRRVYTFAHRHRLGMVTSETDFQLGPTTIRRPDVAFISAERFHASYGDMVPIPVAPDLVFEVVSAHDRRGAMRKRLLQFLDAGTRAVWLLSPSTGVGERFTASAQEPEVLDVIREPDILPGFELTLKALLTPPTVRR